MTGIYEARRAMPDGDRLRERAAFVKKLLPHASSILMEDGYMSDALSGLTDAQRSVFLGLTVETAGIQEFGRLRREAKEYRRNRRDEYRDPLIERHKRRLRKVGLDVDEGIMNMIEKAAETVIIGYNNDFSLH